jgi:hypothetical protein
MALDSGVPLADESTGSLERRASELRSGGAGDTLANLRRLAAYRSELARLDAMAPGGDNVVGVSRRAALREQIIELEQSVARGDADSALQLSAVDSELAKRSRIGTRALLLDPPAAALDTHGQRPDRRSSLRLWKRDVARFERAREMGRSMIASLRR